VKQETKKHLPLVPKTIAPLLTRTIVFLGMFVIISGILGPKIISHGLVNKDGFQIYGGAGKSLLFGFLCLLILIYRADYKLKLKKWQAKYLGWFVLAIMSVILAWHGIDLLIAHKKGLMWPLIINLSILTSIVFSLLTVFGKTNLLRIISLYKRELYLVLAFSIGFYFFLLLVYGLWKILAAIVLKCVAWLLRISGLSVVFLPPRTLLLNKFGINIAEYCSGIESIALFTSLYALIGALDWSRLRHRLFIEIFPLALLFLFALNILRVFGLILAGYYINPQIAFSLFHTYAGMIFFIIYSLIFWSIAYKKLLVSKN
jgi:exosortase/archaeosortase family protein